MSGFLWVLQWILAVGFAMAGAMKLLTPGDKLLADPRMGWVQTTGLPAARVAGVTELLAAIGLVVPGLAGVAPVLTPLAASGLVLQMLLAMRVHARRREPRMIAVNVVLGLLALIVAVGRFADPL